LVLAIAAISLQAQIPEKDFYIAASEKADNLDRIYEDWVGVKTMNRNERDVLAHLHQWHLMMLQWHRVGMKGGKAEMPAPGFSWKDTPALNRQIWEDCQLEDLKSVQRQLRESYRKVYKLSESHSEEELFTKKRYPWTGSTSLGAYLISNTSSHYDWAFKLIRKMRKH
jgi:hypothetical protein